jgi:uncharacterized protein YggE
LPATSKDLIVTQRLLFASLCLSLLIAISPLRADTTPTLSVRGEGELQVNPDQVIIELGITTSAETAREALSANNATMRKVLGALQDLGLAEAETQTRQFRVHPVWSSRPRDAEPGWQASITGYRVNNSLGIETGKIALAGDIIGTATEAGANQVDGIRFELADPRQHRAAAIAAATTSANADAKALATAAGLQLKGIVRISLDSAVANPVILRQENFTRAAAMDSSPPPLQAGDVTVRAQVSIDYAIE